MPSTSSSRARFAIAALALVAISATAADRKPLPGWEPVEPGLWETRMRLEGAGMPAASAQMQELRRQLESLPPEQRKQMEAMLGQQGSPLDRTERYCVTPEEAAEGPSDPDPQDDCEYQYSARQGNRLPFTLRCKEPPAEGSGEVVLGGRKAFEMNMRMLVREPGEAPREMQMRMQNRWVAKDCGNVRP